MGQFDGPISFISLSLSHDKLKEALIKYSTPWSGLAPLWSERLDAALFKNDAVKTWARQVATDQSGARPPHSKELTLPLDQRLLKFIRHFLPGESFGIARQKPSFSANWRKQRGDFCYDTYGTSTTLPMFFRSSR